MANDNYHKFRDSVKFGEPPINNSQIRQSTNGKGDGDRTKNRKAYEKNYDSIKWNSKKNA